MSARRERAWPELGRRDNLRAVRLYFSETAAVVERRRIVKPSNDLNIEYATVRDTDHERVRSDTASVLEQPDGSLLIAYHSYSHGPEGGGGFWRGQDLPGRIG